MHKALRANAPLPNPYLVTLFLQHFNFPLEDEPFVKVKWSLAIGAGVVASFGYQKDMDGQWVRKQDLPPPIPDERTPSPPLNEIPPLPYWMTFSLSLGIFGLSSAIVSMLWTPVSHVLKTTWASFVIALILLRILRYFFYILLLSSILSR